MTCRALRQGSSSKQKAPSSILNNTPCPLPPRFTSADRSIMPSLPSRDFQFLPIPNAPGNPPPLTLSNSSMWTYCGPLLALTDSPASDLPPSFHSWESRTLSASLLPQLAPFLRAAHAFLRQHGMQHYFITVRASQPTAAFDAPRWHTDGHFFDRAGADARGRWKLCATLQGPGTLFAADGALARKVMRKAKEDERKAQASRPHVPTTMGRAACGSTSREVRAAVAGRLERERVVQPGDAEMVFFRVGGKEGAVHSEPRINCDRVFVHVVPGTEMELRQVMGWYGIEEFPRSWCQNRGTVIGRSKSGQINLLEIQQLLKQQVH